MSQPEPKKIADKSEGIIEILATYQPHEATTALYFTPLLPWQPQIWKKITQNIDQIAHGLLFSGMRGIGKHAFVWHLTAWMLCLDKQPEGACGKCQSCLWLKAGTHPQLMVLPNSSALIVDESANSSNNKNKAKSKSAKSSTKKSNKNTKITPDKIKVDDVRTLMPFVNQSSSRRICLIDYADTMTIAAANALLKTLEEPRQGVHLFLISDAVAKLLPTIKSRLQKVPIDQIDPKSAKVFLKHAIEQDFNHHIRPVQNKAGCKDTQSNPSQLLSLASGAPLAALALLDTGWYDKRNLWLTTWLALRSGKRSSVAASDYWQKQLSIAEFIQLSQVMLMDIKRICLGMSAKQQDIGLTEIAQIKLLNFAQIEQVVQVITDIGLSVHQNVQEKLAYDKIMASLANM